MSGRLVDPADFRPISSDPTAECNEACNAAPTSPAPSAPVGSDHGADGRFLEGNQAARKTGIYARYQPADLRMTADELMQGVIADLGGPEALTTLEASYIRKIADVEITVRLLASDIARRGLITPGGGVRTIYTSFLAGIDRFDKLAQRIGLTRRPRPVRSLEQFVAEVAARKAQQAAQVGAGEAPAVEVEAEGDEDQEDAEQARRT